MALPGKLQQLQQVCDSDSRAVPLQLEQACDSDSRAVPLQLEQAYDIGISEHTFTYAGVLVATSLGAFGPLFGSDYAYNATDLAQQLAQLGVEFPNAQLQSGMIKVQSMTVDTAAVDCIQSLCLHLTLPHCTFLQIGWACMLLLKHTQ